MALTFDSLLIPGTHESPDYGEWDHAAQYNRVFGVNGATVLDGGRAMRPIVIPQMWIHNSYAAEALLRTFLSSLDAKIGKVGTLVHGNNSATLPNVQMRPWKLDQGPIPPSTLGWLAIATLHFVQLGPE